MRGDPPVGTSGAVIELLKFGKGRKGTPTKASGPAKLNDGDFMCTSILPGTRPKACVITYALYSLMTNLGWLAEN
jgi:hypothetical protein